MRNYFRIIFGVFFLMGGCSLTQEHFSDAKKQELEQKIKAFEKLEASPTEATAMLDSVYTVNTLTVMSVPIKTYSTNYFFNVNNRLYTGVYNPQEPPAVTVLKIKYLAEDPSINSPDLAKEVHYLRSSKTSNLPLYAGLFFLCSGTLLIYSNVQQIRQRKKEEEAETERSIQEFNRSKGIM